MDRKTYLKKLNRDINRVNSQWEDSYRARQWGDCNILCDKLDLLSEEPEAKTLSSYGMNDFHQELMSYKKKVDSGEYRDRITHCYLHCDDKSYSGVRFEVRGWTFIKGNLFVQAVNWTHFAGTVTITINRDNFRDWKITEE